MALCPDCGQTVDIKENDLVIGDIVTCEDCGAALEVVRLGELELQAVLDEDELDEDVLDDEELERHEQHSRNGRNQNLDKEDYGDY